MSITGVANIFSGRPVHPVGADGRMALSDHLRELRARVLKVALIIVAGGILALIFFDQVYDLVYGPITTAKLNLPEGSNLLTSNGPGAGLLIYFKLCGFAAVVLTSPFWLYQIWAFIMPGLHARERKMSRIFVGVAGPLFLSGVFLGYVTLPKGLEILIGFNPDGLTNLVDFDDYLSFFSRTLLVFGIAFEIPLFVILLNLAGVVSGKSLAAYRPWIVIGVFIFAAVATPSADPFTMTLMAVPMVLLFGISEVICRFNDRRRAKRRRFADLDPDSASPL
ncbi:twin-arginine translocase subunit TatC [Nocardioides sp.]|jgi:sec-independent protein translocase protein TatC|uniref:twin-arginine translocase subunit TatC n=1 Tax=Nocardioides sp. TaxID=35761 RepID=UPI001D345F12|nr:twin-arginine translocase subunit TatC [Nocardioides sp.]MBU1801995.1 twin-arginine translocase subunit TatC [Actinomycetota bacterium]